MIKNVLVPLDGSEHSKAALDYAIWIAQKFDGTLLGQHIIDTISLEGTFVHDISGSLGFEPYMDFSSKMREILDERGKLILDDFAARCEKEGVPCKTLLDMGVIANEICERAKVADLVVIGHRGVNEEFSTGLLGSTAETITRKCPRPIFVSTKKFAPIEKPLLAYDASQRASSAMRMRFNTSGELFRNSMAAVGDADASSSAIDSRSWWLSFGTDSSAIALLIIGGTAM